MGMSNTASIQTWNPDNVYHGWDLEEIFAWFDRAVREVSSFLAEIYCLINIKLSAYLQRDAVNERVKRVEAGLEIDGSYLGTDLELCMSTDRPEKRALRGDDLPIVDQYNYKNRS